VSPLSVGVVTYSYRRRSLDDVRPSSHLSVAERIAAQLCATLRHLLLVCRTYALNMCADTPCHTHTHRHLSMNVCPFALFFITKVKYYTEVRVRRHFRFCVTCSHLQLSIFMPIVDKIINCFCVLCLLHFLYCCLFSTIKLNIWR